MNNSTSINLSKKGNGRVLLITGCSGLGFNLAPHFGVYQLFNYLIQHGISCDLYDRDLELNNWCDKGEADFVSNIEKGVYDVVGISVAHDKVLGEQKMIGDLDLLWRLRAAADRSGKRPLFVAGGQAATLNWQQWLKLGIDMIFLGFAEKPLYEMCSRLFLQPLHLGNGLDIAALADGIPGIAYRDKEQTEYYVPAERVTEKLFRELFFEMPMSYNMPYHEFWDLLKAKAADNELGGSQFIFENVRIYSTSHCPFGCGFCNSQSFLPESVTEKELLMPEREGIVLSKGKGKTRVIQLSAQELGQLVLYYVNKYGARSFLFSDDDFLVGSKRGLDRAKEFCNIILDYKKTGLIPMETRFSSQTRVSDFLIGKNKTVNRELMQLMRNAGWLSCSLGIETFSDKMLRVPSINKVGFNSMDCKAVSDAMIEIGIVPQINIILGIPEYTLEELMKTVRTAVEYIIKGCDLSLSRQLLCLPGAPMYSGGRYKTEKVKWTHPVTGEVAEIPDYFVPEDTAIAQAMEHFDEMAQIELDRVILKMGWQDKIPAKRVISIAALVGLGKLFNMPIFTAELERVLYEILKGGHSQLKDMRTNAVT